MRVLPMKISDALVVWTPVWLPTHKWPPGHIRVIPALDADRAQFDCCQAAEGEDAFIETNTPEQKLFALLLLLNAITVRDGVNPKAAREAFMAITEYRQMIS